LVDGELSLNIEFLQGGNKRYSGNKLNAGKEGQYNQDKKAKVID
jgi:hypothetical protein